jgi:hypothetical protein
MEEFRRPLGVLIAAIVLALLAVAIGRANENLGTLGAGIVLVLEGTGVYVALGAIAVIVWRLVRKRPVA